MSKKDGATPYIVIGVVTILSLLVIIFGAIDIRNSINAAVRKGYEEATEEWYLVCTSKTKDYVVASRGKPYVKGAFYVINGENYITPEPLTTCGMIRKENFDEAVQKKDQPGS